MSRRRVVGLVVVVVVVLAGLTVGTVLALPEIVRRLVIRQLAGTTGRVVALNDVEIGLLEGRLALRGLRVTERDQQPLATFERLEVRFTPRDLLRGHLRIVDATLHAPTVRIVRTGPGAFNVSDLFAGKPGTESALAVTIERFALLGGGAEIEDRTLTPPRVWRVETLGVDVVGVSSVAGAPPGVVTVRAVAAGSPISLWVTGVHLRPLRFHATTIAREIDGALAAFYLPPDSPISPARGTIDVSGTIGHDGERGTRIALDVGLAGVELRRPGQDGAFLSAPAVRIKVEDLHLRAGAVDLGRLEVDGGTVILDDARLGARRRWQADGVALEIRNASSARDAPGGIATARAVVAGSPLTVWVTNFRLAPVELHATAIVRNVDVSLLRLYIPPDLPVQPERGVVNASVQVDHDARAGTRLALDATLGDVELRRPAHVVTTPALRITAGDIAFGGGAVAIGRAAIGAERLTIEDRTLSPARSWPVRDLVVEASKLSSRREDVQGVATARAIVAGASASAWLTRLRLEPLEFHGTAILRSLDVALLRLYLPSNVPLEPTAGIVNASLQVEHTVAAGTKLDADASLTGLEARGRGASGPRVSAPAARITLSDARRHGESLNVGRFELTGSGVLADPAAPARFDLERLRVAGADLTWPASGPARVELSARLRDRSEVEASGTAELTAPLPDLAWKAELGLQLRSVDLAPLTAYVPVAAGLGGRVRATATASVVYAGGLRARVRGDGSASRLALADGKRTPISVRRVEFTGLDADWPERIAIAKLRLFEPRALVERDRQGALPLAARFALAPATGAAPATGGATGSSPPKLAIALTELVVESGGLVLVDESTREPTRMEMPRVDLTLRDATWPLQAPARVKLDLALPRNGTLKVEGTVSGESAQVDLQVNVVNGSLALIRPYLELPAHLAGRVDAKLAVTGPLTPAPKLVTRGTAGLRRLIVSDATRRVITLEELDATGIDGTLPERVSIDKVRVRRTWALLERDRQGRFLLETIFTRAPRPPGAPAPAPRSEPSPAPSPSAPFEFSVREAVFEEGAATVVDNVPTPPVRFEIAGARLAVQDLSYPTRSPMKIQLTSPAPAGGKLDLTGTLAVEPTRLDGRLVLDGIDVTPAQPYLPIEGRVAGRVTADVTVAMSLDPLNVKVGGQARMQGFRLSDGDLPVLTVGRMESTGIDVEWPRRVAVQSVRFGRPRLLIERDAKGDIRLTRLVTPRWASAPAPPGGPSPPGGSPGSSPAATAIIEVGTMTFDRATARFVDQTTRPPYVEQLSDVNLTFTGMSTAPGSRTRFESSGALTGGASFKLAGEYAAGDRTHLELKLDLRDFVLARANPYLEKYTSWTATRGTMNATSTYTLVGSKIDARHDVVLRQVDVVQSEAGDEVERRLGLPLGFLLTLMKDSRSEIKLAVPVSGDLSTREFEFGEAVWAAVRNLSIRLLALPFSKVGSLFFSEDSKVEAVTIAPVVFEAGAARPGPAMGPHLDKIAAFLREKSSVKVGLAPVVTAIDVDALRRSAVLARLGAPARSAGDPEALAAARREHRERWPDRPPPETLDEIVGALATETAVPPDALRDLSGRRLEVVREALTRGGVDTGRVAAAQPRRSALIEGSGAGRVEIDLRP